jgi:hypothetical protein
MPGAGLHEIHPYASCVPYCIEYRDSLAMVAFWAGVGECCLSEAVAHWQSLSDCSH